MIQEGVMLLHSCRVEGNVFSKGEVARTAVLLREDYEINPHRFENLIKILEWSEVLPNDLVEVKDVSNGW